MRHVDYGWKIYIWMLQKGRYFHSITQKDIEVKDLVYAGNGEQKVRVSGSRNRNIKIKGGKFCIDDVLFTPKAKKAITID